MAILLLNKRRVRHKELGVEREIDFAYCVE